MSICRARLRNTSNALTFRMSGKQIRLQVPPKLFRVNSWIAQMIRQWITDFWSGDRKCTGPLQKCCGELAKLTVAGYLGLLCSVGKLNFEKKTDRFTWPYMCRILGLYKWENLREVVIAVNPWRSQASNAACGIGTGVPTILLLDGFDSRTYGMPGK